jgi:hypothetical protein
MIRSLHRAAHAGCLALLLTAGGWIPARGASPGFQPAGKLSQARFGPQAVPLADGTVLVTGGIGVVKGLGFALNSVERFDPQTKQFSPLSPMSRPRDDTHRAVRLKDGRVLVTGGSDLSSLIPLAESFNPGRSAFSAAGNMLQSRATHTATLLLDGRVLIAGGYSSGLSGPLNTAELFDPATGKFQSTGKMTARRYRHADVLLPDGRVVLLGGYDPMNQSLSSVEIYNPQTGLFTPQGSLTESRGDFTATLLPDGRILAVGGVATTAGDTRSSVEIYDPATGKSAVVAQLSHPRALHTATALKDGRVLVAGGIVNPFDASQLTTQSILQDAELIDPATGQASLAAPLKTGRWGAAAALLPDGRVLILGGDISSGPNGTQTVPTDTAEIYVP